MEEEREAVRDEDEDATKEVSSNSQVPLTPTTRSIPVHKHWGVPCPVCEGYNASKEPDGPVPRGSPEDFGGFCPCTCPEDEEVPLVRHETIRSVLEKGQQLGPEVDLWLDVIAKWDTMDPRTLKRMMREGVPGCLRGEVWQLLCKSKANRDNFPDDLYGRLCRESSPCEGYIARDVNRTFPAIPFFALENGLGQQSLFRVMKAFSLYDREVGYVQGMAFLAGLLLLYMSEQDAFWCLVGMFNKFSTRGLFEPGTPNLQMYLVLFDDLLKEYCPRAQRHLKDEGLGPSAYAPKWFLTLFILQLPLAVVVRIWDVFFNEGFRVIFRVGLAIMMEVEEALLKLNGEEGFEFLKNVSDYIQFPESLLTKGLELPITKKKLRKMIEVYKKQHPNYRILSGPLLPRSDSHRKLL